MTRSFMEIKELLFKELMRNGYAERSDGRRVWDVADRCLLYKTDELAKAFLKLRAHPRYKATIINIEMELLESVAPKFIEKVGDEPCNLIDMGCGDGKKAKIFLRSLKGRGKIRFCPVNTNPTLVDLTLNNVKDGGFENVVDYMPIVADLKSLRDVIRKVKDETYQKNVIFLLGSLLASFDIHEYLFDLSNAMKKGDCLVIGNAIRTGDRFANVENYKHPLFEEWFFRLVEEMGFEEDEVEYDARFENGRVECFYKIKSDKKLSYDGKEFEFKEGDEIVVAILYKYYAQELEKYCKMYFREVELVKDKDEEQALICCIK